MNDDKKQQLQEMRELVAQNSWIKTPFAYTRLASKATLIQQNALLMVSDRLQQYIKDFYNMHLDKAKKRPKSLFTEHLLNNGIPSFRIWLADLGVQPNNYKVVREAIEEMNVLVEHPVIDENGVPTGETAFTPVFEEFRVKETGDYYKYETENEQGLKETAISARHYGYIDVTINHKVAEWAFDMSAGYVNHYKLIARYSSKRTTPRLYLLLMREVGKGRLHARFTVEEVKEYLGIVPYKDEKTGEMVTPYPKFAHFKTKVLEAVRQDLNRMARLDQTDITFDYDLVYPGQRKRGDPEYIDFTIYRTHLGDAYNVVVNHAKLPVQTEPVQTEIFTEEQQRYSDAFSAVMADVLAAVELEEMRNQFRRITFEDYDDKTHTLLLQVPDKKFWEWIEGEKLKPWFVSHLKRHFPDICMLNYRILDSRKK
ncbi:MAG: replication initiation protein [Prevotella sp.]|nr:replication initiation protein [Prevotella sp.]